MMKLILSAFLAGITLTGICQSGNKKAPSLGVNFFLNDYTTASRIENSSIGSVLNNKNWARINDMAPGLGLSYMQGLSDHFDVAANLAGSFTTFPNRSNSQFFLAELNANIVGKLLSDRFFIVPYLSAGAGFASYKLSDFYAYIPFGSGLQINIGGNTHLFLQGSYKVGISKDASNLLTYSLGFSAPLKND